MSDHAFLSPSAAERWLACPAAPYREQKYPDTSSRAAAVGTAAHELFERAMRDRTLKLAPFQNQTATNGEVFTLEMCKHVSRVRREVHRAYPGLSWKPEKRVPVYEAFDLDNPLVWGTADLIASDGDRLIVADLKYGTHAVSPKANKQLILYAIGVAHKTRWRHTAVGLVILQPRAGKTLLKRHTYSREELQAFRRELRPAILAIADSPVQNASPGDHCYWCKASKDCAEKSQALAVKQFAEFLN